MTHDLPLVDGGERDLALGFEDVFASLAITSIAMWPSKAPLNWYYTRDFHRVDLGTSTSDNSVSSSRVAVKLSTAFSLRDSRSTTTSSKDVCRDGMIDMLFNQ